ncbi:golgin subfamily A member 2 isoform X2 [Callithrix jacchus]|uniref:golgin subfamily A member 6A isoform X2 n=1 Tax=Callithrix jacchus TaxID=9483 RepID=UPI00159D267A|nr:golgin subfamily A member 6A isoform X2 [Callithrix jacchus]
MRKRSGVDEGAKRKLNKKASSPESAAYGGCQSPGDSEMGMHTEGPVSCTAAKDMEFSSNSSSLHAPRRHYQETAVTLDFSSRTICQLNDTIQLLEKKMQREQLEGHIQTINILTSENGRLKTALYHMGRAARHFEEESSKLAGCLQKALQQREELERTLSAVSSQQDKADRSSPHCEAVLERQLQHSRKELALLKAHMTQMTASLHQVQLERDECCQHLKGERFRWQQGMRKISQEVLTLKLEKRQDAHHMQELERSLAHLRNQLAEAPGTEPPVGPLVAEQQLKFETNLLRKNLESLTEQLQAQVKNNENLNRLSSEQKKRLRQQEESLQEQKERMRLQEEELNNEKKNTLQLVQQIKELQEKLHNQKMTEHLEAATQENQQPQDQLGLTTLPGEGDGGGHLDSEEEEEPRPSIAEALESREAMVAFFNSAGASAQEEQEQLCMQPQERRVCYQHLAHPVASVQEPAAVAPAPAQASGTESQSVCVETNQEALQGAIEKLQSGFMTLRKEEVDLKERVEKLELLFIRLSEETDTMRKDIKSYEQQKAVPKPWHQEEVEKREIKLEQQEPVFPILGDNEGHATFLATAKNHVDEPAPGTPAPQELETVNKQGDLCEVSLADSMEPARDAREGSPQGNPTVGNIEQPVCERKTFQEHPGLGSNPYVPFFYQAAKNREISITIF